MHAGAVPVQCGDLLALPVVHYSSHVRVQVTAAPAERQVGLAVGPMVVTANRSVVVRFTQPFLTVGMVMLAQREVRAHCTLYIVQHCTVARAPLLLCSCDFCARGGGGRGR